MTTSNNGVQLLDGTNAVLFGVEITTDRSHFTGYSSYVGSLSVGLYAITAYNTPVSYGQGIVMKAASSNTCVFSSPHHSGSVTYADGAPSGSYVSNVLRSGTFYPNYTTGGAGGGKPPIIINIARGADCTKCIIDGAALVATAITLAGILTIDIVQLGLNPLTDLAFWPALLAWGAAMTSWVHDGCSTLVDDGNGVLWLY